MDTNDLGTSVTNTQSARTHSHDMSDNIGKTLPNKKSRIIKINVLSPDPTSDTNVVRMTGAGQD